jgi:hypothetical protein
MQVKNQKIRRRIKYGELFGQVLVMLAHILQKHYAEFKMPSFFMINQAQIKEDVLISFSC